MDLNNTVVAILITCLILLIGVFFLGFELGNTRACVREAKKPPPPRAQALGRQTLRR